MSAGNGAIDVVPDAARETAAAKEVEMNSNTQLMFNISLSIDMCVKSTRPPNLAFKTK